MKNINGQWYHTKDDLPRLRQVVSDMDTGPAPVEPYQFTTKQRPQPPAEQIRVLTPSGPDEQTTLLAKRLHDEAQLVAIMQRHPDTAGRAYSSASEFYAKLHQTSHEGLKQFTRNDLPKGHK